MYFPYLRGKMYELLAIRDLIEKDLINKKYVSPIIEPVKDNSTFESLIRIAGDKNYTLNIISNPQVGEFEDKAKLNDLIKNYGMRNSILVFKNSKPNFNDSDLLFYKSPVRILTSEDSNTYNVIPDSLIYRSKIENVTKSIVFQDCFKKKERNADYPDQIEEDFSDYHIVYKAAKYYGFGDYSIIGDNYSNSGFAPHAVAIHIIYFDNNDSLKIRHFVSDSNDDIKDVGNKLHEALNKFAKWYKSDDFNNSKNDSMALKELYEIHQKDKYTGLGYLKKLEIMHHLEIMNRYLSKVEG